MVDRKGAEEAKPRRTVHMTKKCPECFTYLPLKATHCDNCGKRVGEVDKLGFAAKPFDWRGYFFAFAAIAGFVAFIWWGFLKD
jgi:hypothetical protein